MQATNRSNSRATRASAGTGHPRGPSRWLLILALLGFVPGCYTYHAADVNSLVAGEEVRVQVGSGEINSPGYGSAFLGPRRLEGRFADATPDSLIVSLWVGSAYRGTPFENARQDLGIPLSDVALVENRQFSRPRTAILTIGTLGLIYYVIDGLGLMHNTGTDEGEEPITPPGDELQLRFR
jgi:hypothetical protein